jgi:hypothetical protein
MKALGLISLWVLASLWIIFFYRIAKRQAIRYTQGFQGELLELGLVVGTPAAGTRQAAAVDLIWIPRSYWWQTRTEWCASGTVQGRAVGVVQGRRRSARRLRVAALTTVADVGVLYVGPWLMREAGSGAFKPEGECLTEGWRLIEGNSIEATALLTSEIRAFVSDRKRRRLSILLRNGFACLSLDYVSTRDRADQLVLDSGEVRDHA